MLTLLLTSPRVAPGLLTWQAWSALRGSSRVLAGSAGHPQVPALTEAGVLTEVVYVPAGGRPLAAALAAAVTDGSAVWLAPPGERPDAELLAELAELAVDVQVLNGSRDVPGAPLLDLVTIMDRLRVSCPWDREQTHESLVRYLLEEAYEAVETVETGDLGALREEIGDVLFQVFFHARIAAERGPAEGGFTIDEVAEDLAAKLIRRHPHVFGSVSVSSAAEVNANWEDIKKAERAERAAAGEAAAPSVLDGVAFGQPALSLAAQLQRRAARAGIDVRSGTEDGPAGSLGGGSADRLNGGPGAGLGAGLGAELMALVAQASAEGIDPELELRRYARRFADAVREFERVNAEHQ